MYTSHELSAAPSSVLYGNGFASFKKMEPTAPLNSLADNFALVSEKRRMLMAAAGNQRSELGKKMMTGGGPYTTQGESQLARVYKPRGGYSLLSEDEYGKIGGMMANFFMPRGVGLVGNAVAAAGVNRGGGGGAVFGVPP